MEPTFLDKVFGVLGLLCAAGIILFAIIVCPKVYDSISEEEKEKKGERNGNL
jgi:hypothetical protein